MRKIFTLLCLFSFSFPLFSQNYTILGSASALSGCNSFQLTPNSGDQHGAIFQNQSINLNNSFDFTFSVFLGCGGSGGADGIVFALTNNPNGLGSAGEGLGYAGPSQPSSIGVEFDTWQNGSASDPPYDHIGIESGGGYFHNVVAPVAALPSQNNIDDCAWHTVRIVWDVNTGTFSVYFDGSLRSSFVNSNLVNTYFGGNPVVYWGWTGATGGGTNDQQVRILTTSSWVAGANYQSCNKTMQFTDISTSNLGNISTWAWNFGDGGTSTSQNPTHTYAAPGTYTVTLTITDISGCATTYSHDVTINPPITMAPTLDDPNCNGGSDGGITIVPAGGFGPAAGYGGYMYSWSNGTSQSTLVGATAGTYTLTVTDGVCTSTGQYTLNQPPAVTASVTHTDANCGAANGTASITITGGTGGPYFGTPNPAAVNWGLGHDCTVSGQTYSATGFSAGTFIADFQDANGCSAVLQYSVNIASLPCGINISTSSTPVLCFGLSTGSATVTVTGGTGTITYAWSNGGNTPTISNQPAGNYTYSVTDQSGNPTIVGTVSITQSGAAMAVSLSTVNMSCSASNDGSALASVTAGGTAPFNYLWSGVHPNNPVASGLSAGPISVTVSDANSCSATASGTVTGPPTLTINVTHVDDSCFQSRTGSALANVGGGNPPYTYSWSNIGSAQNNLSLGIGNYVVTVTDSRGCTITGSTSINQPAPFTHTLTSTNINCFGASTGTITLTAGGGIPNYTYIWNPNTASGIAPANLAAGKYVVTIQDANRCQIKDSVVLTQPATALTTAPSHTNVTCSGASNGSVAVNAAGSTTPYTYVWNPNVSTLDTISGLGANTYAVTVTDNKGCTATVSETVTDPGPQSATVTGTNNLCFGATQGTASAVFVNPTGSVTYSWSGGLSGSPISNLVAGVYNVTATDANLCTVTGTYTVTAPAAVVMTVATTPAPCFGGNGTATATPNGGTGPFNYTWSGSSSTTNTASIVAGNFTVTSTDANTCQQTASGTISEPAAITIQVAQTDVDCFGASTGAITLTVTGGTGATYTYAWTPNVSTTNTAGSLAAGPYRITVTDQALCTKDTLVTIAQPALPLTVNAVPTDVTCFGLANGIIRVTATGGTAGYTYAWNPNTTNVADSATNLSPGPYDITVTDSRLCTATGSANIAQPSLPLSLIGSSKDLNCFQSADGLASVTGAGGTIPYTYSWTPNVSVTASASALAAGNYTVTITDNRGCTKDTLFVLTQPVALTLVEASHTDVFCHGNATGAASVTAQGGTLPYAYSWNPNVSTTTSATNLAAATYNITVTDGNVCTASVSIAVLEPAALTIAATPTAVLCFGGNTGAVLAVGNGGTTAYSFTLTDGTNTLNSANGQFNSLIAGNYVAGITDANSCVASVPVTVTEPTAMTKSVVTTPASCYQYADGKIEITTNGGVPAYSYSYSNGVSNGTGILDGLIAGMYTFTITDATGACPLIDSAEITEPDSVTVTITPNPTEVKLGESLQLNALTNQVGLVTYSWSPAFGLSCTDCANPIFDGVYSYTYNVTVTNNTGCTATANVPVTVIPLYDVFIPNIFTPNGDGTNDTWQLFGNMKAFKQMEVMVFNRWGEKVFESTDINFGWDGRFKGDFALPGVYSYSAKFVWLNNHSDSNYKGTITLIR